MRALIVDDEPLARERMRALLADIDGIHVVGEAADGYAAIEAVQQRQTDVVLLDIDMPRMDGLEAARHLGRLQPAPAIVFCTAYDEYALAAFDANAVDYLLKPVRSERLRAALQRARRFSADSLQALQRAVPARTRSHVCGHVRGNLVLVAVTDIHYLLSEDKYVVVHHPGGTLLIEEALKALEQEFASHFVRIHRNCLVARDKLAGLDRLGDGRVMARLEGVESALEVSRRNLPALRKTVRSL